MEAWIQALEKAKGPEVIDVDAAVENTMVVFSAIEELRKVGLKKRDMQLVRREDIMDGRVCANRVKIDELHAKVTLGILDAPVEY